MVTPILETGRILLRPLRIADAETAFKGWASDPDVVKYMNYSLHRSVEDTVEWLAAEEENVLKDTNYTWGFVLKENGELFGSGGINYSEEQKMFELGYNIMKKYWNLGLATEAARAIIDFAVRELGIVSFFGKHARENPASGRVMEKVGFVFQREGKYTTLDGKRTFESREYVLRVNPA